MMTLVVTGACAPPAKPPALPSGPPAPELIRVRFLEGGRSVVRDVPLEEYVQGTILSEFAPATGEPAAIDGMLQIQAVISRTYAVAHPGRHRREGFDLCATTHCQLYEPARVRTSRWSGAAALAVQRTSRSVLWFDGHAATALFHADCGGHTSTPVDVWGGRALPYLTSARDDGPADAAHTTWRYAATADAIRRALNAAAATRVGTRLERIEVTARDRAGRAERLRITGAQDVVVRGDQLREALTRAFGVRTIKSTWFDVRRAGDEFVFEGRGFGHGVGLCQAGALARVKSGAKPNAVLQKYYPGTRVIVLR
jgi:stage II sporulation protein D